MAYVNVHLHMEDILRLVYSTEALMPFAGSTVHILLKLENVFDWNIRFCVHNNILLHYV
jgi:hypothetical protein